MKSDHRNEFRYLVNNHIYMNHAAVGPYPSCVATAVQKHNESRYSGNIENFEEDFLIINETKRLLAELIKAPSEDHISLTPSTSAGINSAVSGLPWSDGDQILVGDIEFPSNVLPYKSLEHLGVEIVMVESQNGRLDIESFKQKITPKTKAIAISAVQYLSGFKANLSEFGNLAKENDCWFFVDAIQGLGVMDINVTRDGIDILAGAGHKWLLAPFGTGYMYTSKRIMNSDPIQKGWLSVKEPWELQNYLQDFSTTATKYEQGVNNVAGYYGLHASLTWFNKIGQERIEKDIQVLTDASMSFNEEFLGWKMFFDGGSSQRGGIVTFDSPRRLDAEGIVSTLKTKKISVSTREGKIRISPHFYNTMDEVEEVFRVLSKL